MNSSYIPLQPLCFVIIISSSSSIVIIILHDRYDSEAPDLSVSTARKESAKEKQLKEEEKILESVAEGRGTIKMNLRSC